MFAALRNAKVRRPLAFVLVGGGVWYLVDRISLLENEIDFLNFRLKDQARRHEVAELHFKVATKTGEEIIDLAKLIFLEEPEAEYKERARQALISLQPVHVAAAFEIDPEGKEWQAGLITAFMLEPYNVNSAQGWPVLQALCKAITTLPRPGDLVALLSEEHRVAMLLTVDAAFAPDDSETDITR